MKWFALGCAIGGLLVYWASNDFILAVLAGGIPFSAVCVGYSLITK